MIIILCCAVFLSSGGVYLATQYHADQVKSDYIELELRFLEERQQDFTEFYRLQEVNNIYPDYNPDDHSEWGILTKEIPAESNSLGLDFTNIKDIDFETELLVWSVNRRIVKMLYPVEGWTDNRNVGHPTIRHFPKVILSKQYDPGMVFYYAIDKMPYDSRLTLKARVYDEYTQVEE